jgi:hypothetical protein
MTSIASRKQARRFFGSMGATMRRTSRWHDTRRDTRADTAIRPVHGYPQSGYAELPRELMAR